MSKETKLISVFHITIYNKCLFLDIKKISIGK